MRTQFIPVFSFKDKLAGKRRFYTDEQFCRFMAKGQDKRTPVRRELVECAVVNGEPVIPERINTQSVEPWMVRWLESV